MEDILFTSLPNVLMVQLKRFNFESETTRKMNSTLKFENTINFHCDQGEFLYTLTGILGELKFIFLKISNQNRIIS